MSNEWHKDLCFHNLECKREKAAASRRIIKHNKTGLDTDNMGNWLVSHFGLCVRMIAAAHRRRRPIIGRRHSTENNQNDFYKLKVVNFRAVFLPFTLHWPQAKLPFSPGVWMRRHFWLKTSATETSIELREQKENFKRIHNTTTTFNGDDIDFRWAGGMWYGCSVCKMCRWTKNKSRRLL